MGYRSDVGIGMYTKDYNTMIKRAKALKDNSVYDLINYADRYTADKNKVTILHFTDIRWHTDYKSVQWIENFIQKIDSVLVRVGENLADNEETCFNEGCELFEYCYLERSIGIIKDKQIEEDGNLNELLEEIDRRL